MHAEKDGIRLDRFVKGLFPDMSNGLLRKFLRKGDIMVNYQKVDVDCRLSFGDLVGVYGVVVKEFDKSNDKAPECGMVMRKFRELFLSSIIYKDQNVTVIHKPAGMVVQGDGKGLSISRLLTSFEDFSGMHIVHRIDKATSGVLVIANTHKMSRLLCGLFSERHIHKIYYALVGNMPPFGQEGTISDSLINGRDRWGRSKMNISSTIAGDMGEEDAKSALTHYKYICKIGYNALLRITPITGRKHQIRAHLASVGCPIVGDKMYEGPAHRNMCLHAYAVSIPHIGLTFLAPLPSYMTPNDSNVCGAMHN